LSTPFLCAPIFHGFGPNRYTGTRHSFPDFSIGDGFAATAQDAELLHGCRIDAMPSSPRLYRATMGTGSDPYDPSLVSILWVHHPTLQLMHNRMSILKITFLCYVQSTQGRSQGLGHAPKTSTRSGGCTGHPPHHRVLTVSDWSRRRGTGGSITPHRHRRLKPPQPSDPRLW